MKISGAELAAQRTAQRKHRALYNYGDLVAYKATKFANFKCEDQSLTISRAYHASCVLELCKGTAAHTAAAAATAASSFTPAKASTAASSPRSWFFVNFGGTSDRKLPVGADVTILDHPGKSDHDDRNDPSYIDPQFTTGSLEMWQLSLNHTDRSLSLRLMSETTLPIALVGHSMIPYRAKNKLIIYGGAQLSNRSLFSNIYVVSMKTFDVKQFRSRKGVQPAGRLRHSACLMNDKMFVYGGQCHSSAAICLEDFWCLDLINYQWSQISPLRVITNGDAGSRGGIETQLEYDRSHGPGKRYGHQMTVYKGIIYVAFGSDGSCVLDDVWGFKDDSWFRIQLLNHLGDPYGNLQGRVDFAAALNEETGIWLFHGGINADGQMLHTILEINLETYECRRTRVEVFDESIVNLPTSKSLSGGGGASAHYISQKSSLSSSNGSNNRLLPAIRGHAMIHIPKTNYYVLTRGVNRYNEFTQTEYILTNTQLCPMQLEQDLQRSSSPLADLAPQQYEVTPIFDTTHYLQSQQHMPEQPPTLLQPDLRAADTQNIGQQQHTAVAEFDCNQNDLASSNGGGGTSGRAYSPMLVPQRLSAPRKQSNDDDDDDDAIKRFDSPLSLSQNSSCDRFRNCDPTRPTESENSGSPRPSRDQTPYVSSSKHGRVRRDRSESNMELMEERVRSSKYSSLAYWRERCLAVERENIRLRTQVEKLALNLADQQNTIGAVVHLLSRFSVVDIDQ